jgi:hypothetical protein
MGDTIRRLWCRSSGPYFACHPFSCLPYSCSMVGEGEAPLVVTRNSLRDAAGKARIRTLKTDEQSPIIIPSSMRDTFGTLVLLTTTLHPRGPTYLISSSDWLRSHHHPTAPSFPYPYEAQITRSSNPNNSPQEINAKFVHNLRTHAGYLLNWTRFHEPTLHVIFFSARKHSLLNKVYA